MSEQQIPSGMRTVTKEEFWKRVMSETRDVMPRPERNYTAWEFTQSRQRWGWCSEGYVPSGRAPIYALA
jgi:hypothetical protein